MSYSNWNTDCNCNCNCNCNCPGGYSGANTCNTKKSSEVSGATTCSDTMNTCYRQGYACGFKSGYETGFRDGFWTASGCGRTYGGNVMGSSDYGCGCK